MAESECAPNMADKISTETKLVAVSSNNQDEDSDALEICNEAAHTARDSLALFSAKAATGILAPVFDVGETFQTQK